MTKAKTDTNIDTKTATKAELIACARVYLKQERTALRDMIIRANDAIKMHHYTLHEVEEWFSEAFCKEHKIPWKEKTKTIVKVGRYHSHNSFMTVVRTKVLPIAIRDDCTELLASDRSIHDIMGEKNTNKRTLKNIAEGKTSSAAKDEKFKKQKKLTNKELAEETGIEYVDTSPRSKEKQNEATSYTVKANMRNSDVMWMEESEKIAIKSPWLFIQMLERLVAEDYLSKESIELLVTELRTKAAA